MKNISKIIFLCFYRSRKEKSHYASCKCLKENFCQCCMSSIFTLKIDDHLLTCLRLLVQQTNRCKEETKSELIFTPDHRKIKSFLFYFLMHIMHLRTNKSHLLTTSRISNRTRWSTWPCKNNWLPCFLVLKEDYCFLSISNDFFLCSTQR